MVSIEIARDVAGLFVGSILYGLYLPTLFFCLQCLIWDAKKPQNSVHWLTLLSALMLWACSTLNLIGGVARSVQTITHCDNEYGAVIDWTNIIKLVTTLVAIMVGDSILVYRCWIVWRRNYSVILLPFLLLLANTSCAGVIIWILVAVESPFSETLVDQKIRPFFLAHSAIAIPLNVITTSLLLFPIWMVHRETTKQFSIQRKRTILTSTMRIVAESGILYTASALISFCTYVIDSNAFYIAVALQIQLMGIAFNLIIIRTHKSSGIQFDEFLIPTILPGDELDPISP